MKIPGEKTLLTIPVPIILKQLIETKMKQIVNFTFLYSASKKFY